MLLLIFVLLIIAPALTYYVSTTLFYQTAKSTALGKEPPTIPYFVPGATHAFGLASNGQQNKEYGNFAPFSFLWFVVLRDPEQMKKAMHACEQQNAVVTRRNMHEVILGSREAVAKIYADAAVDKAELEFMRGVSMRKYLEGSPLANMTNLYADILSRNMNDKMFQVGSWTQIEDVWSFFQQVLTRCSMEALFGSAIFKQYPGLIKDYWKFEDAIQGFLPVLPWFATPRPYKEPLDRLCQGIEKWLRVNHSGTEFAKTGSDDADWDEHRGSKFIQERDDIVAKAMLPLETRTAEMLDIIHCSNVDLIPSSIWSMIELLRKPYLAGHVTDIASEHKPTKAATCDVNGIIARPLYQSLQAEVSRLRIAQYMICTNPTAKVAVDSEWTLPKESNAISFSQDYALNTKVWANAPPHAVSKPLEEFWAERFLAPSKDASKAQGQRKGRDSGKETRFDAQNLELLVPAVGDKQAFGLASDYIKAMQAVTLTVLLSEFEMQLCDPDLIDAAMPELRESAFGQVRPKDKIAVRIRKRRTGKEQ
ncbi:hypothetical protein J4E91_003080 [Alternaria rosae]|nr:hypothetical protein J4E91_003080 [Alternaria rosae]